MAKKVTNGCNGTVVSQDQLRPSVPVLTLFQVSLNCTSSAAFPLEFPASLKNTKYKDITRARAFDPAEYPLNGFCMVFFSPTRGVGDAQVLVPKPERPWVPQIELGVLVQSPRGPRGVPLHPWCHCNPHPLCLAAHLPSPHSSTHRKGLPTGTSHLSHRKSRLSTLLCPEIS